MPKIFLIQVIFGSPLVYPGRTFPVPVKRDAIVCGHVGFFSQFAVVPIRLCAGLFVQESRLCAPRGNGKAARVKSFPCSPSATITHNPAQHKTK